MRESICRYARVDVVGADSSSTDGFEADRRILGHRGRDVGAGRGRLGQDINDEEVGPEEMDDDTLEILTPDAGPWAEDA